MALSPSNDAPDLMQALLESLPKLKWARDHDYDPAKAWGSTPPVFSIIWDPDGYHLWDAQEKGPKEPVGIFSTLAEAKSYAEECI